MSWTMEDLEMWDERIQERVRHYGLSCYPQDFEICTHSDMLGYMSYHGMPSHYPHWSHGKAYEKLETLYKHDLTGLPYEMVINANPSLAYLMRDNSLLLQILTIAHVYGHNDFFKNNVLFKPTHADHVISMFKAHADIVRGYIEDPSIGIDRVEAILDAAQALSFHRAHRYIGKKETRSDQIERLREKYFPRLSDDYPLLHARPSEEERKKNEDAFLAHVQKVPIDPDPDLLEFIAEYNPLLQDWERNLIRFVDEAAQYFMPQIETKIMNEGWASYWHKRILDDLALPEDMRMEFFVRHNGVLRPKIGGINPYHIGFVIWNAIRIWYDGSCDAASLHRFDKPLFEAMREAYGKRDAVPVGTGTKTGLEMMFAVRTSDRDNSFLQRFLTQPIMSHLNLFAYTPHEENLIVSDISDDDGWMNVKRSLMRDIGLSAIPVIRVVDANVNSGRTLELEHVHDGRDLELEEAKHTLGHVYRLWRRDVVMTTYVEGKKTILVQNEKGFTATEP